MNKKLNYKILKAIQRGLYEGLSKYDLTMLDDEDSVVIKNNNYKHQSTYDDLIDRLLEFLDDDKMFKSIVEKIILLNKQYIVKDSEALSLLVNKSIKIFGNECNLNWIDTSLITNMSGLFLDVTEFNGHIENWNVSNVENMKAMFAYAESFNQPINKWNTSKVKDMSYMFNGAEKFNQSIENWNVSNVEDMQFMFYNAISFNQPINKWNTSNVTDMSWMLAGAKSFNQPIGNWDTSNVKDMSGMFVNCPIKEEYKPKFK